MSTSALIKKFQKGEGEESEEAYRELFFRFRKDLLDVCWSICRKRNHTKDFAIEIAEKTLKKYYKSRNYREDRSSVDNIDKGFLLYLSRIARNVLNDHYKSEKRKSEGKMYSGIEGLITDLPDLNGRRLSPEKRAIYKMLSRLPKAKRIVYLTYEVHEIEGTKMPRKLLEKMRNHLGITQDTIRCYKKEVRDRVNDISRLYNEMNHGK